MPYQLLGGRGGVQCQQRCMAELRMPMLSPAVAQPRDKKQHGQLCPNCVTLVPLQECNINMTGRSVYDLADL